jgi:hypothetical protein
MGRHLAYIRYVFRHKWYVFLSCASCGLWWRGIKHDWSRFLPSEWMQYTRFFYMESGEVVRHKNTTGYYKATETGDSSFEMAVHLHLHRNDHHWEWWCIPRAEGLPKVLEMSDDARTEMICDWMGAGRAKGTPDTVEWYKRNKDKLLFHPRTREIVEKDIYYTNAEKSRWTIPPFHTWRKKSDTARNNRGQ